MTVPHDGNAWVRETHRVHHAPVELGDPRRRCAVPRLEAHCLRDDSAESIEPNDFVQLLTVGRCTRGEEDGILEIDAAEPNRQPWIDGAGATHWPDAVLRRW